MEVITVCMFFIGVLAGCILTEKLRKDKRLEKETMIIEYALDKKITVQEVKRILEGE